MKIKKIINGLIAGSVISMATIAGAQAAVKCPSADDVKGAYRALNTVMRQSQKSYFVLTAQPVINASNKGWMLLVQSGGSGFDAAYDSAVGDVKAVMAPVMGDAIEQQGMLMCAYMTSSGSMNVLAVSPPQQGLVFNPTGLNLEAAKAAK